MNKVGRHTTRNLFLANIRLACDMAVNELVGRYKRTALGFSWLVLTPLAFLGIYWFVFGFMLNVSWKHPVSGEAVGFIAPFFTGLSVYLFFADLMNTSPNLFVSKRHYVTRVQFPIWVLWLANLIRAGIHWAVALLCLAAITVASGIPHTFISLFWSVVLIGLAVAMFGAFSLFLCVIGPFIGDVSEATRLIMRVLFYAAPISYPLAMVPEHLQHWLWLNPLTPVVEMLRSALIFSQPPALAIVGYIAATAAALVLCSWWFLNRMKEVVADVV